MIELRYRQVIAEKLENKPEASAEFATPRPQFHSATAGIRQQQSKNPARYRAGFFPILLNEEVRWSFLRIAAHPRILMAKRSRDW